MNRALNTNREVSCRQMNEFGDSSTAPYSIILNQWRSPLSRGQSMGITHKIVMLKSRACEHKAEGDQLKSFIETKCRDSMHILQLKASSMLKSVNLHRCHANLVITLSLKSWV